VSAADTDGAPRRRIAAVVPAAGFSSRMGDFKPLLPLGSTTVVGRVIAGLKAAGIDEIVVVVGHRADALAPVVAGLGARPVVNPDFARGMYTSFVAGFGALDAGVEAALILPVDVPLVRPATIRRMIGAASRASAALAPIHHPVFLGVRGHPPIVDRALFAEILAGDGEGGLAALLARHEARAVEVPVFDRGTLLDMDRRDDHARLVARLPHLDAPDPDECAAILAHLGVGAPVRTHCRAVARLAGEIAAGLAEAGLVLDRDRIVAAGLLHDLAKGRSAHAEVGGRFLAAIGFPAVGEVVAAHMRLRFAAGDPIDERVVVHLADKLIREDRPVSLTERFAGAEARFRDEPAAAAGVAARRQAAEAMAEAVERRVPGLLARASADLAREDGR
jgi:CTP:molybdopterin cytidylyltransferase MocA